MMARKMPPSMRLNLKAIQLTALIAAGMICFIVSISSQAYAQNNLSSHLPTLEDAKTYKLGTLKLYGVAYQGGWFKGKLPKGHKLRFLDEDVKTAKNGAFIIGIPYKSEPVMIITYINNRNVSIDYKINITQREYKVQRIDGLPKSKVTPPKSLVKRVGDEFILAKNARSHMSDLTYFQGDFIWPAQGRISGRYGAQRILNGKPRTPHWGIDIANKTGTEIIAPADGLVILVHPGMYLSGKTMIIDHGHGLISSFLHLNKIYVNHDTHVKRGQPIGSIGSSGRSTGPHLDWRISWRNQRIDAATFVSKR